VALRRRHRRDDSGAPGESRLLVDLAAWKIGTLFFVIGVVLLYVSALKAGPHGPSAVDTTVRDAGALLFVTGVLGVFWDLLGRRALTRELLSAADLSSDITNAGLKRVARRYLDVEWDKLLEGAAHVDLFFAYGRTWRSTHATPLRHLVERDGTRLRAILPDRDNAQLMTQLAAKFRYSEPELIAHIENAESDFANLQTQAASHATVEVRRTAEFPVYTYYRFDRRCFAVLYSQAPGRVEVPTFECEQGGNLYAFFRDQFEKLWEDHSSVRPLDDDQAP
jgi:hypothetical protein